MDQHKIEIKIDQEPGQRSLDELTARRSLCLMILRALREQVDPSDTRLEPALNFYQDQLGSLDRQITELTGKPPSIVIGLKAAQLTAKSEPGG